MSLRENERRQRQPRKSRAQLLDDLPVLPDDSFVMTFAEWVPSRFDWLAHRASNNQRPWRSRRHPAWAAPDRHNASPSPAVASVAGADVKWPHAMTKPITKFEKPIGDLASQTAIPILKFERADWTSFRTVEGLQQKAGVPANKLRRLAMKELADNALDNGARVVVGELPSSGYFVENDGDGLAGTPQDIAHLFSIARPLVSTKLLRLRCLRVAWMLDHLFNAKTGFCNASNPYLARCTGLTANKVQEALAKLEADGAIKRSITPPTPGGQRSRVIYPATAILAVLGGGSPLPISADAAWKLADTR